MGWLIDWLIGWLVDLYIANREESHHSVKIMKAVLQNLCGFFTKELYHQRSRFRRFIIVQKNLLQQQQYHTWLLANICWLVKNKKRLQKLQQIKMQKLEQNIRWRGSSLISGYRLKRSCKEQIRCTSNSACTPLAPRTSFYFSSARPRTQQADIRKTLKETGEPALHKSVSQQPTAQSSPSHLASWAALHSASVVQ